MLVAMFAMSLPAIAGESKDAVVTAKEIETFGNEMQGQRREMACKFSQVSDTWVQLLLRDNRFVGVMVEDSNGDLFQYAFASKEKYGRELIKMKRGDSLRLVGKVQKVGSTYVFMIEEIRK
jgi:hypothetical protein